MYLLGGRVKSSIAPFPPRTPEAKKAIKSKQRQTIIKYPRRHMLTMNYSARAFVLALACAVITSALGASFFGM